MRQVRIVYDDNTVEYIGLKESAFGTEGTVLHQGVKSATIGEWVDEGDGPIFPSHNRLSRSMRTPIYGTGRDR
jgi:hypothetical protein